MFNIFFFAKVIHWFARVIHALAAASQSVPCLWLITRVANGLCFTVKHEKPRQHWPQVFTISLVTSPWLQDVEACSAFVFPVLQSHVMLGSAEQILIVFYIDKVNDLLSLVARLHYEIPKFKRVQKREGAEEPYWNGIKYRRNHKIQSILHLLTARLKATTQQKRVDGAKSILEASNKIPSCLLHTLGAPVKQVQGSGYGTSIWG